MKTNSCLEPSAFQRQPDVNKPSSRRYRVGIKISFHLRQPAGVYSPHRGFVRHWCSCCRSYCNDARFQFAYLWRSCSNMSLTVYHSLFFYYIRISDNTIMPVAPIMEGERQRGGGEFISSRVGAREREELG